MPNNPYNFRHYRLSPHNFTSNSSSINVAPRKSSRLSNLRSLARYDNIKSWLQNNLRNYCNTTSLHGFNYITLVGLNGRERYFWIVIVIIAIMVSIGLVMISWFWGRETPTVTVIESSHYPTWFIPFPAVTICNFNKISKSKALLVVKTMRHSENITEEKLLDLFRITMYQSLRSVVGPADLELLDSILRQNNMTLNGLTDRITPDCMDMIVRCLWKGSAARCDSLFQRIYTAEGVCCAFNYFGRAKNNFPEKIAFQVPKNPYRVAGCGYATGITVLLNPIADDYMATYFSSYGFRLLIHDSYNFPDENSETKVITSARESFIRINPESTYATNDVKGMSVEARGCVFSNERKLSVLQRYSFINCMAECRVQMLYKRCGCVPMHLPNNGSYPPCSVKQVDCVIDNRGIFTRAMPTEKNTLSIVQDTKSFPCGCEPDCEANNYLSDITMGRLNVKLAFNQAGVFKAIDTDSQIVMHVFFSDLMCTRYRKDIHENWLSALATFGGLLGLVMGFSIVTAFEFFYFLTFRPIFNYFNDM